MSLKNNPALLIIFKKSPQKKETFLLDLFN